MNDTLKIFQLGSKAYYDEVPRYKNPYYDEECHTYWEMGWKAASSEHNLFTENQTLKAQNMEFGIERAECMEENMFLVDNVARLKEKLEVQEMELKGDVQFAQECEERFKEDAKNFAKAFDISIDKIEKVEDQTVEISTLLDETFYYCTDSSVFSFRREKLIGYLKSLRIKVSAMKKEFPERITKTKKKP